MEVAVPPRISSPEFNFSSGYASPHMSAPSTPKRFGDHYFSAPSSPTRASAFYQDLNDYISGSRSGSIPYEWEEKPGTPKSKTPPKEEDEDEEESSNGFEFAFDFSRDSDSASSVAAADELFDGGKIKLLKPPPRLQIGSRLSNGPLSPPKSPIARIRQAFSPRDKRDIDPFAVAMEQSRRSPGGAGEQRGRERAVYSSSNSSRKGSRSLSPYRSPAIHYHQEVVKNTSSKPTSSIPKPTTTSSSSSASSSRRWSFRDLLLFRSASEGRASDRDPLRKFSLHSNKHASEDLKNSSFRSVESSGSSRKGRMSAHELHYKSNRAVAEEMKRKTVLPYKQGLFGWFRI